MTISLLALAALLCAFLAGAIVGAYGHKWIASKVSGVGLTPPSKLP